MGGHQKQMLGSKVGLKDVGGPSLGPPHSQFLYQYVPLQRSFKRSVYGVPLVLVHFSPQKQQEPCQGLGQNCESPLEKLAVPSPETGCSRSPPLRVARERGGGAKGGA